uniref:Uncharacterized protein n=1 Tax=Melanthalia intermedia TaxID=172989 RepID=A0A345UB22_9FLOR|nr:hypothetical protein [Melanthalia intermedia]AXI97658.1 hypothetical protein [Melanthalia intermedia]
MNNIYLNKEITRITSILTGSQYSSNYFRYKSNNIVGQSSSEDDWNFCLLILKFVNPNDSLNTIAFILEAFLRRDRYRDKFNLHYTYLQITISKVLSSSISTKTFGCLYEHKMPSYLQANNLLVPKNTIEVSTTSNFTKSCNVKEL